MEKNLASFIKKKIQTNLGLQDVEVINNSHLHQHHSYDVGADENC
jgi:BolA family transcriptional regulator, general stress-responsive regulator